MKSTKYQALTANDDVLKIIRKFFQDNGTAHSREFTKAALKKHLIKTEDGSFTFNSNIRNGKSETMHTNHGAVTEAMEKFVKPAKLEEKNEINLLDICCGLGYNTATCIEYLNPDVKIYADLIEISTETIASALFLDDHNNSFKIIKKVYEDKLYEDGTIQYKFYDEEIPERINIDLYLDDARNVVKEFEGSKKYDAIFLDPFSPSKSPELFTEEFILILKNLLADDGVILTYTSAAPVRMAMINAGLHLGEGPSLGRSGGTIASLNPENIETSLSMNDERMIALSDAGIPFKDPHLNSNSQSILKKRNDERKALRGKAKFPSTVKTPVYLFKDIEDGRLKHRVMNNLKKLGFDDLNSLKSRYVVCPQYQDCICGKNCINYNNSYERINEMKERLKHVLDNR